MFPEHPVLDTTELRRRAGNLCASLSERIAPARETAGDLPAPEDYSVLATGETASLRYDDLPEPLREAAARIESKRADLLPLYNRFTLAWLIVHCDPESSPLRVPRSILALYTVHFARLLEQMDALEDGAYDLENDAYVKEIAILRFKLLPLGEIFADVNHGPTRRILWGGGLLQAFRAGWTLCVKLRGRGPILIGHTHSLAAEAGSAANILATHHRLADLVAANAHLKAFAGQSWMVDPALEFITPHHSVRTRAVQRNGGSVFKLGTHESSTAMALSASTTRRLLYEEGKYVPANYLRLWPRGGMVDWSQRDRPSDWGAVGMESRVPPPDHPRPARRSQPAGAPTSRDTTKPETPDQAEIRRHAEARCRSLSERVAEIGRAVGARTSPEEYAALALVSHPPRGHAHVRGRTDLRGSPTPAALVEAESRLAATRPRLVPLYNRFTLAWLILNADPEAAPLRLPISTRQALARCAARVLGQMDSQDDEHFHLRNEGFVEDLATLGLRRVSLGEFSVEEVSGPSRGQLLRCRTCSWSQALRRLRLSTRALTPVYRTHAHRLENCGGSEKEMLDSHHRLADLAAANPRVKAVVGEDWRLDPELELVSATYSLRWRIVVRNGGVLLRVGRDETATEEAMAGHGMHRGEYVPTVYMTIWPRDALVRWSRRSRPSAWGAVGMDGCIPWSDRSWTRPAA